MISNFAFMMCKNSLSPSFYIQNNNNNNIYTVSCYLSVSDYKLKYTPLAPSLSSLPQRIPLSYTYTHTHSLTHSPTLFLSFSLSLTHSLTLSLSLSLSLSHSLSLSLTHSLSLRIDQMKKSQTTSQIHMPQLGGVSLLPHIRLIQKEQDSSMYVP